MWVSSGDSLTVFSATATMGPTSSKSLPSVGGVVAPAGRGAEGLDAVMDRYAQGEDRAFDDLYRIASPRVRGFLLRLAGDPALADDLTQETFVRVHRARGAFEPSAAALPWLYAIARNALVDHRRREKTRRAVSASLPTGTGTGTGDGAIPEPAASLDAHGDEVVAASETLSLVRATLDTLTPIQREAFILVRFEGLSIAEAAQVLGATEAAVKVRAFRAYEALREALARRDSADKRSR
jgi:RNA polymerase sigma-70 factor (ECF subfamily)